MWVHGGLWVHDEAQRLVVADVFSGCNCGMFTGHELVLLFFFGYGNVLVGLLV